MDSGSLSLWPLGQGHRGTLGLLGAGQPHPSPEKFTFLFSPQGPRRDFSQEDGHSGVRSLPSPHPGWAPGPSSLMSSEALVSGSPAGLSISSSCLAYQRLSRAIGPEGVPDPVTPPIQCSPGLSCIPVMGRSPRPMVALLEFFFYYTETCLLVAAIHLP